MGLITLVQGFKVSVSSFDVFLQANGLPPIEEEYQPCPEEAEDMAKAFRVYDIDCEVRVFVPYVTGYNWSRYLFVCCNWIHVLAMRDIEGVLQKPIPPAFEQMRASLGAEPGISRYIVYNEEALLYTPQEVIERHTVGQLLFSVTMSKTG